MEPGVFSYIIKHSKRQQIILTVLAVISLPFLYASLDLPKTIINKALGAKGDTGVWPKQNLDIGIVDFPLFFDISQVQYLLSLSVIFLALVVINGMFKFKINVYRGSVGERMLRRLRHELVARVMRFPKQQFRKTSQGEIVSMVTLETEPLGGFFGDAFSLPIYQGGMLLVMLGFMFVQDPILGIAAIALYPVQMYVIPKLQAKVNALGKSRVQNVRRLSERIGEVVTGAPEIHAHDTSQFEQADFSSRLGTIYDIRFDIYQRKFFIKFLNNFLAQMTPFFFFSIGGFLVIKGSLTIGALVAILGAYKDVAAPWKMLLTYYQRKEDARIKYEQLLEKFQISDMLDANSQIDEPAEIPSINGQLVAANVSWEEDDGLKVVDGATLSFDLPKHVALIGPGGGGKSEFAQLIARQLTPSAGQITIGGQNIAELPETVTGRRFAYVDQEPYLFAGTIRDNILYGLKHRPMAEVDYDGEGLKARESEMVEAVASGNSTFDVQADWVDGRAAGVENGGELVGRIIENLGAAALKDDVFQIGLRRTIDPGKNADLAEAIMGARGALRQRLEEPSLAAFVESFDAENYNDNASVAENILFGTPVGDTFAVENLGENEYVMEVLDKVGIRGEFLEKGRKVAEVMVELFQGLPPDHEFFERFSFISSDDLPEFESILRRAESQGLDQLDAENQARLRALPFKLISARHHLDILDDDFKSKLLEARREFASSLPEGLRDAVEFFDVGSYNAAGSIQDNILFGKRDSSRAGSAEQVGALVSEVVDAAGLRERVIEQGLEFEVGIGGNRMSAAQRQKLAIARALIKRPDMIILNEAMSNLDATTQGKIVGAVREAQEGRSVLLVDGGTDYTQEFEQIVTMESGRITSTGTDGEARAPAAEEEGKAAEGEGGAFGDEIDALAAIPLFAGIDRSKLKLLAFASERFKYEAGQTVFNQGDVGEMAYIVVDGEAAVILETLDGPKTVAIFTRGDLFGELALLCDAPRTATIEAHTDLTVLSISKDVFFKIIAEDVKMSARLTRAVAERLERTTRDLSDAASIRDSITNLPDSRAFAENFHYIASRSKRNEEKSVLLYLDVRKIIDLSEIESEFVQNRVLRVVGERIESVMRGTDALSRLRGKTFFMLINPVTADNSVEIMARRVAASLGGPIEVDGGTFDVADEIEFCYLPIEDEDMDKHIGKCVSGEGTTLRLPAN